MNVAITGGTGFLGTAIVRHLVASGDAVAAIIRPTSRTDHLPCGVTARTADICDAGAMREALAGAEVVIHAAALVSNWRRRWDEFQRINVEAPAVVCEAAADAGARLTAYISSFIALGPSDGRAGVNEDTRHDPDHFHNHYERSKALADERVRELAKRGVPVVTVYPGVLYGPGPRTEGNYVTRMFEDFVAGRVPGVIGSGDQRWSFVHVDDVAAGVRRALASAQPGARYVLGGENVSMNDLFALLGEITGVDPPARHVGPRLAWLAALVQEMGARLTGRVPALTRDAAAIFAHEWACDSSAAARDLSYTFRPLADALREWWKDARPPGDRPLRPVSQVSSLPLDGGGSGRG